MNHFFIYHQEVFLLFPAPAVLRMGDERKNGIIMKSPRRTPQKKGKVRKEDIPILLTEYQTLRNRSGLFITAMFSLTATVAMILIAFKGFATLESIIAIFIIFVVGLVAYFLLSLRASRKASKIAKVLEIEELLKRYLK